MKFDEHRQQALDIALSEIDQFPWTEASFYANWLSQTYHYSSQTVSLLSWMTTRTDIRNEPLMHAERVAHTTEEIGHDKWVEQDIQNLGFSFNDFPELPHTKTFWQVQFNIRQPVEWMYGYTILLEQLAIERGGEIAKLVSEAHGQNCIKFLTGHEAADIGHVERDFELIRSMSEDHQVLIAQNMYQTAIGYAGILRAIKEEF